MSDQTTPRPVPSRVAVGSMELFDYREGYKRMAEYVAAHLDARVKAECRVRELERENARMRGELQSIACSDGGAKWLRDLASRALSNVPSQRPSGLTDSASKEANPEGSLH